MQIKSHLTAIARENGINPAALQLPDCELDPVAIRVIMINEVVPKNPDDWFYSEANAPENQRTALGLFEGADVPVKSMGDILDLGVYITAALKTPKAGYAADPEAIKAQLPLLAAELALFPNLKAIMLMGDVAKKAVNLLAKAETKKNVIPSGSTYKIRDYSDIGIICVTPKKRKSRRMIPKRNKTGLR
jgi:hypothetical protein